VVSHAQRRTYGLGMWWSAGHTWDGVAWFQYDLGKSTPGGFLRTSFLNAPPALLLSAISKLQDNNATLRTKLLTTLSAFGHLRDQVGPDLLFEPTYEHAGGPARPPATGHEQNRSHTRGVPVGLRLFATDGTKRGHYIALSHCWGTQTPFRTTVRNFERACAENSMG
jgi:hypothetical protein